MLTQQEDPFTRTPFFMLHPCRSEEFMSNVLVAKLNPLITWLSSIAPMVNLKLDTTYGLAKSIPEQSKNFYYPISRIETQNVSSIY